MANLSLREKRHLERFLEMESGYVLDFSNRTFRDFFADAIELDIEEEKYYVNGSSKANRMRAFWELEANYTVGVLLEKLAEYWLDQINFGDRDYNGTDERLHKECVRIANRLKTDGPVENLDAITPNADDEDFKKLAENIKRHIKNNEPDTAIDRLHTFTVKYIRALCDIYDILYDKNTPLHSLLGGYVKYLKQNGKIESIMTERILKSSISVLEAFNSVRNDQSFAHDNELLNYNESLLIFNDIANILRFIESIEKEVCDDDDPLGFFENEEDDPFSIDINDLPFN